MRAACAPARRCDDIGRVRAEDAVEDFVGRDRKRDKQPDGRSFFADGGGGNVEFGDHLVNRLLGQLGQVPLS